jgi:peptide/nickel transport system permease protein
VPAEWINFFRRNDYPTSISQSSSDGSILKNEYILDNGQREIVFSSTIEYPFREFPQDVVLFIEAEYQEKAPHVSISWITPDGREIHPKSPTIKSQLTYNFSEHIPLRPYLRNNSNWNKWFVVDVVNKTPEFYVLFADPNAKEALALPGNYQFQISALTFEEATDVDVDFLLLGQVHGWAGTDYLRRDLLVPLLWGMPFALTFGLIGATLTTIIAMVVAAAAVWFGGRVDSFIQRLTEVNMILPILAVGVLIYYLYDVSLWAVLAIVIALNIFGGPTKAFRAAFLQEKGALYIEAARAYGTSNSRIIFTYMIPRITPTLIPQLVALIPSMVFLEATLSILGVYDPRFPTWGRVIHDAIEQKALWGGSFYWVLEPIALLLLTGLAFALLGFALERVLNPRLQTK